jgi:molecular chaperone GrpE (heat shock protein)
MNDQHEPTQTEPASSGRGRRGKTRAEERIDALDTPSPADPTIDALHEEIAELQARAETAEAETESIRGQWQRTAADFANYKRRSEEDRFRELGLASEGLLRRRPWPCP